MKSLILLSLLFTATAFAQQQGTIEIDLGRYAYYVSAEITGIPAEQMHMYLMNNGGIQDGNGAHEKFVRGQNISCYSKGKEKVRVGHDLVEKHIIACSFIMTQGGAIEPNVTDGTGPVNGMTVGNGN